MIEFDPGHRYGIQRYPSGGKGRAEVYTHTTIQFRKEIGENYPGNEGVPIDGTSSQELLRILIKRALYVNNQKHHVANLQLIERSRQSIYDLEERAAFLRGHDYYRVWEQEKLEVNIEDVPTCPTCGHIFCRLHNGA